MIYKVDSLLDWINYVKIREGIRYIREDLILHDYST